MSMQMKACLFAFILFPYESTSFADEPGFNTCSILRSAGFACNTLDEIYMAMAYPENYLIRSWGNKALAERIGELAIGDLVNSLKDPHIYVRKTVSELLRSMACNAGLETMKTDFLTLMPKVWLTEITPKTHSHVSNALMVGVEAIKMGDPIALDFACWVLNVQKSTATVRKSTQFWSRGFFQW